MPDPPPARMSVPPQTRMSVPPQARMPLPPPAGTRAPPMTRTSKFPVGGYNPSQRARKRPNHEIAPPDDDNRDGRRGTDMRPLEPLHRRRIGRPPGGRPGRHADR